MTNRIAVGPPILESTRATYNASCLGLRKKPPKSGELKLETPAGNPFVVVASGNLSEGGFVKNIEWGLFFRDPKLSAWLMTGSRSFSQVNGTGRDSKTGMEPSLAKRFFRVAAL